MSLLNYECFKHEDYVASMFMSTKISGRELGIERSHINKYMLNYWTEKYQRYRNTIMFKKLKYILDWLA